MTVIGWVIILYLILIVATLWAVNYVLRTKDKGDEWKDGTKGPDSE